jgi:hypothetical protein
MDTIPVLQSTTQVNIPGIGKRDAKCLAGGYVFHCRDPSNNPEPPFSSEYKPTIGINITTMMFSPESSLQEIVSITPNQRNAAIAQWWLDNCFPTISRTLTNITDTEEDTANAFWWWLSEDARFIQVDGWERDVWRGFAVDILADIQNNHVTFRQATGIEMRTPPRPRLSAPPHFTTTSTLLPPPLRRPTMAS